MPDALARVTARLLARGAVPASQVSARTWRAWHSLREAGALIEERHGSGRIIRVYKPELLREWLLQHYPSHKDVTADTPVRAAAVATRRNAKRARRLESEPVLIRAWRPIIARREDTELNLMEHTRPTGVGCLLVEAERNWSFTARLALIENLEVFLYAERLLMDADLALYTGGRLSQRVLAWLAGSGLADCSYLHCGDYDPVGLDEYLRLKRAVGKRARLHVPDDLATLIATYGRPELLRDSTSVCRRLRGVSDPALQDVLRLLDETGCGLEQEVLLLR